MSLNNRSQARRIGLACILFLLGGLIFGAGQKDSELRKAEKFIDAKQYNDAILILTQLMREKPEYAQKAEELLKRIRETRDEYGDLYSELVETLEKQDVDKALRLANQLEKMDKGSGGATASDPAKSKETSTAVSALTKFNAIMLNAGKSLEQKKYWEALRLYRGGLEIGRDAFDRAAYDAALKERILKEVSLLDDALEKILALETVFRNASDALEKALRSEIVPGSEITVPAYHESFPRFFGALSDIRVSADAIKRQSGDVTAANNGKEDMYVTFLIRLIDGRANVKEKEGILSVPGKIPALELETAFSMIERSGTASFADAKKFMASGRYSEADKAFTRTVAVCMTGRDLVYRKGSDQPVIEALPVSDALHARVLNLDGLSLFSLEYERYMGGIAAEGHNPTREELGSRYSLLENLLENRKKDGELFRRLPPGGMRFELEKETVAFTSLITSALSKVKAGEMDIVSEEYTADVGKISGVLDEIERKIPETIDLIAGTPSQSSESSGITRRFPGKALELIDDLEKKFDPVYEVLKSLESRLKTEKSYILDDQFVKNVSSRVTEFRTKADGIIAALGSGRKNAENMILLAKKYRQEGELRFREAETAIAKEQFETGRQKILKAQDNFISSLSQQDDPELRAYMDREVLRLSGIITQGENTAVVREVRRSINEGKSYYLQGVYEKAEDSLLSAQTRWSQTNVDRNSEIEYWLGFVKSALFVKSSRDISETHPLYNEMRQMLNFAYDAFNRGKKFLKEGNRTAADRSFSEAEARVLQVKIPFPFNRDANILPLQILKLRDAGNFKILYSEKFKSARELVSINPNEGYMALKDLEEIDPGFPGLKDALYAAEIRLGMRIPPPDPAASKESEKLYQQAYQIFSQNRTSQFQIAVEQLSKALVLNPDNAKAIELKDRILMTTGGRLSLVLGSNDQQEFRLAEEKFLGGKYIEALSIVERLLKKGSNDRYLPLLQLKGRIESKI